MDLGVQIDWPQVIVVDPTSTAMTWPARSLIPRMTGRRPPMDGPSPMCFTMPMSTNSLIKVETVLLLSPQPLAIQARDRFILLNEARMAI